MIQKKSAPENKNIRSLTIRTQQKILSVAHDDYYDIESNNSSFTFIRLITLFIYISTHF